LLRPVLGRRQGERRAQRALQAQQPAESAKSVRGGADWPSGNAALTEPHPR
jgi:hypothetical protein